MSDPCGAEMTDIIQNAKNCKMSVKLSHVSGYSVFFNYHLHKVRQSTPSTPLQNIPHLQSTDHISSEVWKTFIWQMVPLSPLSWENVSFSINLLMTSTLFLSPAYLSCSSYKWASLVCSQTDRLLRNADAPFIWD